MTTTNEIVTVQNFIAKLTLCCEYRHFKDLLEGKTPFPLFGNLALLNVTDTTVILQRADMINYGHGDMDVGNVHHVINLTDLDDPNLTPEGVTRIRDQYFKTVRKGRNRNR